MRFDIITILACVGIVRANAIPHSYVGREVSLPPRGVLEARDSYDCAGSSMCKSLKVAACDDAVNSKIIRNDVVNYGADGSGRPHGGACSAVAFGFGCGVFIQGDKNCARTGNQIWWDYQDIRKNNCHTCGSKHWGNGCLTTINYVSGCTT